jgi:hypothetical protein
MEPLEVVAALGAVIALVIAVITLLEKITGAGQRWLSRGVAAGLEPLRADVNDVKSETRGIASELQEHKRYTRYHLGPNGQAPRLHERVQAIESHITEISQEQAQVRHDLEDM